MLKRDKITAIDLTNTKSDDPLGHATFAESADVVRLIGTRLASGQALTEGHSGIGDTLGFAVKLRLSTNAIRTVEHNGGIDAFLTGTAASKLPAEARRLKKQIEKAAAAKAVKAAA